MFCIYKFYGAGGTLLYVGYTSNFRIRLSAHKNSTEWFHLIDRTEIIKALDQPDAYRLETMAIRSEKPIFNVKKRTARETYEIHANAEKIRGAKEIDIKAYFARGKSIKNSQAAEAFKAKSRPNTRVNKKRQSRINKEHKAMLKKAAQRRLNVIRLRRANPTMSAAEIGRRVDLSRERVRVILQGVK
jgi:predicted GIY-YIG superfamily endonuclease